MCLPTAPAPELKREQDYLGAAREALARMREQTLSLKVQAHDPISAEHLARTLHLRAASLQDDPVHHAVLRPDRHRQPTSAGTSAAATSPTPRATRS